MSCKQCDPDQMPHKVASDLGLHCLLKPVLNTYSKYDTVSFKTPEDMAIAKEYGALYCGGEELIREVSI